jgi:RNA polymerase sigma-70 factor (ECF subfamily)
MRDTTTSTSAGDRALEARPRRVVRLTVRSGGRYGHRSMSAAASPPDGDLARAISASVPGGAEAAETELYRRFAPRVRLYGLRHLRSEDAARDLVQQVLLLTIQKLREGSVREADQIASFVLGVSRTMAIDLRRQERRRERLRATYLPAAVVAPDTGGQVLLDRDRLETCLAKLVERDRAVVLLTFYGEGSAAEVARETGLTEGHVRVIRHRAIQRLRACVTAGEGVASAGL